MCECGHVVETENYCSTINCKFYICFCYALMHFITPYVHSAQQGRVIGVCVDLCVFGRGIVSTRLTGLDGTVPAQAYRFDSCVCVCGHKK